MMTNAYSELYINDSSETFAEFLDFMVSNMSWDYDRAFYMFARSDVGRNFSNGNPKYICGMSGVELARSFLNELNPSQWIEESRVESINRSETYWAGWALCRYQWYSNISFHKMFESGIKPSWALGRYILHEADISKFYEEADRLLCEYQLREETMLKRLRLYCGYTQKQLSEKSGVSLRMIQLYEQKQNDISKASFNVVFSLAQALNCRPEDIVGV